MCARPTSFASRQRVPDVGFLVVAGIAFAVLAASCTTSGRELDPPDVAAVVPGQVAGAAPAPTEFVAPVVTGVSGFELRSATFAGGSPIPLAYTLDGGNQVPPLQWVSVPADTAELAVVMRDIDNDDEIRWFVVGIPPDSTGFTGGQLPAAATVLGAEPAIRGGEPPSYLGPELALGVTHRYVFTLFAFDTPTGLGPDDTFSSALEAVNALSTTSAALLVTYTGA